MYRRGDPVGESLKRAAAGAVLFTALLSLSACALHWPWHKRVPGAPPQVHELTVAPVDASGAAVPALPQNWDRNTLLVDLQGLSGEGALTLTPNAQNGWPVRLEFRVQPGSFAQLEVLGAERVVFAVPASGAPLLFKLPPSAYQAATPRLTLQWHAADDSPH